VSGELRVEGWQVSPLFEPDVGEGSTTSPSTVTLLFDEHHLTQLSGEPERAWQTPWDEIHDLELRTTRHHVVLSGRVGGVTYRWRTSGLGRRVELDDLVAWLVDRGVRRVRARRHLSVYATVIVVLVASGAGFLASSLSTSASHRSTATPTGLAQAKAIGLSLRDLPSDYSVLTSSVLSYLVSPGTQTFTPSTTTTTSESAGAKAFRTIVSEFESCVGIPYNKDRTYGGAGQEPDLQVSSKVYGSSDFGGTELATTTQYYPTTLQVRKDTAQFDVAHFGTCFAASNADSVLSVINPANATKKVATSTWTPDLYVKGYVRAGVATFSFPGITTPVHLIEVVTSYGHIEETISAVITDWPQASHFLASVVNTILSRVDARSTYGAV